MNSRITITSYCLMLCLAGLIFIQKASSQCTGIYITNPSSLIPNAHFEDRSCCPETVTPTGSQFDCLNDHIQASAATTDYHVTGCGGSLDHPCLPYVPFGTPLNNGLIGVVNTPGWKEYLGTCLTGTLNPGTQYTLTFKLGFGAPKGPCTIDGVVHDTQSFSPFTIALFGGSCTSLPFPGTGCPAGSGWVQLDYETLSGYDQWVEGSFVFTVQSSFNAIVFGPDCSSSFGLEGYYYLDDLILNETNAFAPQFNIATTGHPCSGLMLTVDNYPGFDYAWFYNGNPITGATSNSYQVPIGQEGNYYVEVSYNGQCEESNVFTYEVPILEVSLIEEVCYGESVEVGGTVFDASGDYTVHLTSINGCDSIVYLNLIIREQLVAEQIVAHEILCAGGTTEVSMVSNASSPVYLWNDGTTSAIRTLIAGNYEVFVTDVFGCESEPVAFTLTEPDSLKATFILTHETCVGYEDGTLILLLEGGIPPYEVQFQSDDFLPYSDSMLFTGLAPFEHAIVLRDSNLCLLNNTFTILPREPVNVFIESPGTIAIGDTAILMVITVPPIELGTFNWQGNFLSCDTCSQPFIFPQTIPWNQYAVQLTERIVGCPYDANLRVKTIDGVYISNVFAPNKDGFNDLFFIQSNPNSVHQVDEFFIHDRWGEMMHYQKAFLPNVEAYGWDGNFRDAEMPSGVYVWFARITLTTGQQVIKKGTVTLLR